MHCNSNVFKSLILIFLAKTGMLNFLGENLECSNRLDQHYKLNLDSQLSCKV